MLKPTNREALAGSDTGTGQGERKLPGHYSTAWTPSQLARRQQVEAGLTVVANLRKGRDAALIEWASQAGLAVRIDRKTPWGNPFAMPGESDRAAVCDRFARYLPTRPPLMGQVATLKGKVLLCWCHPALCHGDHLAALANGQEGNP